MSASDLYEAPLNGVTLLYGPPGSGKSSFCREAAGNRLKQELGPVIYITTECLPEVIRDHLLEAGVTERQLESLWVVDAYTVTGRTSSGANQRGRVLSADCTDLASIGARITELSNAIGRADVLLVFDSLTSPYLFNGSMIVTFLRAALIRFALMGNRVLVSFDEGSGKKEDLVALQSMSSSIIRIEQAADVRVLHVMKFLDKGPLTVEYEPARGGGISRARVVGATGVLEAKVGERRLAAIMFTDVVGYTALAQKDEPLAMQLLAEHARLLRPIFSRYGGREVKSMGDSFLVEFSSALEAFRCAVDIQRSLHERNVGLISEKAIFLRIGVHIGDVISSDGDILGDAVNIAERIRTVADPGEICVSEEVYDGIRNKIELPFARVRAQALKHVSVPIGVYKAVLPWTEERRPTYITSSKRRVAVLPFKNMSRSSEDEYFAEGLTEELITVLSSIKELSVVARTSVMAYKDSPKKATEIGAELSVGTLVGGSVRKVGKKIRLTVQLIDTENEGHIWAHSYDRELSDIFQIQSDIARRVARALRVKLVAAGTRRIVRKAVGSDAYILYLKGIYFRNKASEDGWRTAVRFFERAIELEPRYADAMAALSVCYCWLAYFAFEQPGPAYQKAKEVALQALKISNVAEAHLSLFFVSFYYDANWKEAEAELKLSLRLNPSSPEAHRDYAFWLANLGRTDEAVVEAEKALELDPLSEISHVVTADVYAWTRRYDQAISKFMATLEMNQTLPIAHHDLGVAYLAMGRIGDGIKELEKAQKLSGGSPIFEVNLAYAYGLAGRREEALRIAEELEGAYERKILPAYFLAIVYSGLADKEKALDWLSKAYDEHATVYVPLLNLEPAFVILHGEPRFEAIVKKLGLASGPR